MKRAVEYLASQGTTTSVYDPDKIVLGTFGYRNTGAQAIENWISGTPVAVGRPMDASTAVASGVPYIHKFSENTYYLFLAENSTAAATRRVVMYTYNRPSGSLTWNGLVTLTFPTATFHTVRGMEVSVLSYSTGTVGVSGTAVTGAGTAWVTEANISVGSRIGFGSTDATQITTWYQLSAVTDTSITLTSTAGTIAAGTPYVIEEYRVLVLTTNATAANGGLFLAKGLNPAAFTPGGTSVPAATTVDAIRAVYWLADAATVTNTAGCGIARSNTDETYLNKKTYVLNGATTTPSVFVYNPRAVLTGLAAGKTTSAFVLVTGAHVALTGTTGQNNNGKIATTLHGPGSGVECLYFYTTTRVYRAPLSAITSGATSWVADVMVEVPAGTAGTYAASGALSGLAYDSVMDRFVVVGSTTSRSYYTRYKTDSSAFDYNFMVNTSQLDQALADPSSTPTVSTTGTALFAEADYGLTVVTRGGITAALNQFYVVPHGGHWDFSATQGGYAILPRMATPGASRFYKAYLSAAQIVGGSVTGWPPDGLRVSVRTAGIADNSGGWTLLNDLLDISALGASEYIQFKVEFHTIGGLGVMSRLYGITAVYEDSAMLSNFQPSLSQTNATTHRFAWRHAVAFGTTVPALRIQLKDATSGGVLAEDTTSSPAGTWEKSVNGGLTWAAYNTTDKANEITYIRWTPASMPAGVTVVPVLTRA